MADKSVPMHDVAALASHGRLSRVSSYQERKCVLLPYTGLHETVSRVSASLRRRLSRLGQPAMPYVWILTSLTSLRLLFVLLPEGGPGLHGDEMRRTSDRESGDREEVA